MSKIFKDFQYDISYDYTDYRTKAGKRDYAVVFKYLGSDTKVTVPSEIEGYPVIGMVDTFTNREELEEIILPNYLEEISYGCFRNCKNIKKIEIPKTLKKIGREAFSGCSSLEEIILPQDDEFAEHMAENGLKSRDNILYSSFKSIIPNAEDMNDSELIAEVLKIYGDGLAESTIKFLNDKTTGDKWTHSLALGTRDLGQNIFAGCTKLIDENGFVILDTMLVNYYGESTEITIPRGVTKIADFAFYEKKKLKSVVVPDGVYEIGLGAFFKCQSLTGITLPNDIKELKNEAFRGCKLLEAIALPEKLEKMHNDVFHGCAKLKNIQWNENLDSLYGGNFSKCTLIEEMHFPKKLEWIGQSFQGCKGLREITIPESVSMIEEKAFAKCENLEIVNVEPRIEGVSKRLTTQTGCFAYTEKMHQNLLGSGKTMHERVVSGFNKANEEKYRLDQIKAFDMMPQEDKDVFLEAWNQKISATSKKGKNRLRNLVFLKSTAKEMNAYFNAGCHLELAELDEYLEYSIKNENTTETAILLEYKNKTFDSAYLEAVETRKEMIELGLEMPTLQELREKWSVKVEKGYIKIVGYKGKDGNETLPEAIDTGKPIRVIGISDTVDDGRAYMKLETLRLPEGVEIIEDDAFKSSSLKEINIPNTVTEIGAMAFFYTEITEISLPNSLKKLSPAMFSFCANLEKVKLPENITEISNNAFNRCYSLKEISLPDSITIIGHSSFEQCYALEEIRLPSSLLELNDSVFQNCTNLKKVIIENDNFTIGNFVFLGCENLEFIGTENGENMIDRFIIKD